MENNINNYKAIISSNLATISSNFQAGVSTIVNAVNAKAGSSLSNSSAPSLIAQTISNIVVGAQYLELKISNSTDTFRGSLDFELIIPGLAFSTPMNLIFRGENTQAEKFFKNNFGITAMQSNIGGQAYTNNVSVANSNVKVKWSYNNTWYTNGQEIFSLYNHTEYIGTSLYIYKA